MSRLAALGTALLLVLGCRTLGPGAALAPGDPRPGRLLQTLVARADLRHGLRATAHLALEAPDLQLRRPQRLAVQRPARLRFEILGLFRQTAAVLVTDGERFDFFEVGTRTHLGGPATRERLWELARVDLTPEEAVELLLGAPRLPAGRAIGAARVFEDGSVQIRLRDAGGSERERLRFDAEGRLTEIERRDAQGGALWAARFADYRNLGSTDFAHDVELRFARQAASVRLRFDDVELNPDLPPEVFVLQVPPQVSSRRDGAVAGG